MSFTIFKTFHGCASANFSRQFSLFFAKRSVVSAANYAERSSFDKDQISNIALLSIEVNPHANEVRIQPNFVSSCSHDFVVLIHVN